MKLKTWFKRQYVKMKVYYKIWKYLHVYDEKLDHYNVAAEFVGATVIWKHNPYYFPNSGNLLVYTGENVDGEIKNFAKQQLQNRIWIPFPIGAELYLLMNDLRID